MAKYTVASMGNYTVIEMLNCSPIAPLDGSWRWTTSVMETMFFIEEKWAGDRASGVTAESSRLHSMRDGVVQKS